MSDSDNYKNPVPGITYISPRLKSFGQRNDHVRIASKVFDQKESFAFGKIKDEVILRQKEGAKSYIKAKFIEETRGLFLLSIQGYSVATDKPYNASFTFINDEIPRLMEFIGNILAYGFKDSRHVNINDEELRRIVVSEHQARQLLQENEGMFAEVLRHQITREDIVAIGYRKKQLDVFSRLLNDPEYFADLQQRKKTTKEGLWQNFFEKNKWIFGYGLGYIFLSGLDGEKLEQVVQGHSVANYGKRVDALMKTRGLISSLCFVEIKSHDATLLQKKPYRVGCWAPATELTEGVAQIQGTVASALDTINTKLRTTDQNGNATGEEVFNFQPRSYLVIGALDEFVHTNGVNEQMYRSFELYRKNMLNPEIITFDELYERSRFIVDAGAS